VDNTQEYTCLSLHSGYGGLELGLKRVCPNIRTVAYVEVEAFACANLVSKMEQGLLDAAPIWTDTKTFNGKPFRDRIYIITAGYPCQPFSVAGLRKGTDDPRHLWPYIERIIETVRPVWFFGENVSGHLTIGFPEVYRSLRNMGYAVEAELFTAAECGAPHRRERLFILGHSEQYGLYGATVPRSTGETISDNKERSNTTSELEGTDITRKLADSTIQRLQGSEPERTTQARRQIDEQSIKWPARPGQQQYEWEEPRTIMGRLNPDWVESLMGIPCNWTGMSHSKRNLGEEAKVRIDRLRLLGNGAVPQQAEKAFRYLMGKYEF